MTAALAARMRVAWPAHPAGEPETRTVERLGAAVRVEHDRVHGLAGSLACPYHELECRIVPLAGVKRAAEGHLALLIRQTRAAGQKERMAKHYHVIPLPNVEMTDP